MDDLEEIIVTEVARTTCHQLSDADLSHDVELSLNDDDVDSHHRTTALSHDTVNVAALLQVEEVSNGH